MFVRSNPASEVVAMSEVDISEELPNGDEAFANPAEQPHEAHDSAVSKEGVIIEQQHDSDGLAGHVFVATSQGLLTAEQLHEAAIKTTHIVIHDQTLTDVEDEDGSPKSPNTPLPPPTPATPSSRERGYRYQWDANVNQDILPVRCKSSNGELYKNRFGSGIPGTI